MRRYKYHQCLRIVLGKNYCIKERLLALIKVPGSLQAQKDFAEALKMICNLEAQGSHFGLGNRQLSLEGASAKYGEKEAAADDATADTAIKSRFRTYLSDDKRQDSRTVYVNDLLFIKEMRELGLLQKGTNQFLLQLMDGCRKQYR